MFTLEEIRISLITVGIVACASLCAFAQEFRGSITGRVTDNNGAAVVNATVTITNSATNTSSTTTTSDGGDYTVLYLIPGYYTVTVEAGGFKKASRPNVEIRVGDKLQLDMKLEVGAVSETVNITTDAPLLETASASAGQVIDRRRISELPLSDGNPFVLSRLAPGVAYTGDLKFSRPFDNAGTSAIVADGAPGGNEFTLDGSPNMASGRRVAFVPPADAVQEFKVETASFDAQQSHTAGATVNVTLKSGGNELHGTLYEFLRNDVLSGTDYFVNRAGVDADRDGKADRPAVRYNRYGGSVGGPIILPKKVFGRLGYDGRNRTFFFFAYEGLKDKFPEPRPQTVPTAKQRNGDFSDLLAQGIVIYDPLTARRDGVRIRRDPFPGNIIPSNRISQIAKNYLQFYPLPNQPGDAQGRNNYFSNNPRGDDFHSESYRFDQTISEKQKFFFRYTHNNRREFRGNWSGVVNGIRPTGNFLFRINNGGTYDHVYTFSPTTILNYRVGFSRFWEPSIRQHQGEFDPKTLGFSSRTTAFFGDALYLPRFEIGGFSVLGDTFAGGTSHNIYSVQPVLTKIVNNHSFRFGYDFRSYRENSRPSLHAAGRYDFGTDFTRGPLDNSPSAAIGQQLAAFILGQPTGGFIDRSASRANQTLYHGIFVQDDWKVTRNLTLNLGVRYELEGATTDRFNQNIRGFDASVASPIQAAARTAYAANPIPEISPANFNVRGGLLFADSSNRGFWEADKNNIQPRIGIAYKIGEKMVLRGGWAIYTVPFIIDGVQQPGFSQATNIVPTLDAGLTFRANLFDPFPDGVTAPPGASEGIATFLGRGISFVPLDRSNGQAQRWEFGFQYELPGNWLVEGAYVGDLGYDLTTGLDLNPVPAQYLSNSLVRDQATINFLTANVRNPFQGLLPGTGLNGSTVQRQQLLRPFPQFTGVSAQLYDGSSTYHSGQLRSEKRFSRGYTLLASYTWSKFLEETSRLNATDADYEKRVADADITHRFVMSGIWELPFGRGRALGKDWNGVVDAILGGWQLQGIYQIQSGRPLSFGNIYFGGDPSKLRTEINGKTVDQTFDTSGFYFTDAAVQTNGVVDPVKQRNDTRIRLANNIRTFPSRFSGFRGHGLDLLDLSLIKNFSFTETIKLQLRGEFINAFNHAQFNNPNLDPTSSNFGKITSQANLPRDIQIGLKLIF
jgi:hypothetical protein